MDTTRESILVLVLQRCLRRQGPVAREQSVRTGAGQHELGLGQGRQPDHIDGRLRGRERAGQGVEGRHDVREGTREAILELDQLSTNDPIWKV